MTISESKFLLALGAVIAVSSVSPAFADNGPQLPATMTMLPSSTAKDGLAKITPVPAQAPIVLPQVEAASPTTTVTTTTQTTTAPAVASNVPPIPTSTPSAPPVPPASLVIPGQTSSIVVPGMNPGQMTSTTGSMSGQGTVENTALPPLPNDRPAYEQALQSNLPMTPAEVLQYRQIQSSIQQAETVPVGTPPTPLQRALILSLKPGLAPAEINLYPGNATTLTFADETGAAWPVETVTVGNPNAYSAQKEGQANNTNMVVISPLSPYAEENNLVVTLKNCPVPLVFSLKTGSKSVDYRVDFAVQGMGPNATPPIEQVSSLAPTDDSTVQSFIDGTPPHDARVLKTSDPQVQAWKYNDLYYVRTNLTMLSPAYIHSAQNLTVNVYTIPPTPVLVLSDDGRMSSVTLNFSDSD
jgi:intracellular multiplication protein IcmK